MAYNMSVPTRCQLIVVWEYELDIRNTFGPYQSEVSNFIEEKYQAGVRNVSLSQADRSLENFELNLNSPMYQKSRSSGNSRVVRRMTYNCDSEVIRNVVWEWMSIEGWTVYNYELAKEIEQAYQQGKDQLDLETSKLSLPNIIYFRREYQQNKHSHFVRPIQRRTLLVKYKREGDQDDDKINDLYGKTSRSGSRCLVPHSTSSPSTFAPQTSQSSTRNAIYSAIYATSSGRGQNSPIGIQNPLTQVMRAVVGTTVTSLQNSLAGQVITTQGNASINDGVVRSRTTQASSTVRNANATVPSGRVGSRHAEDKRTAKSTRATAHTQDITNPTLKQYCRVLASFPDEECSICLGELKEVAAIREDENDNTPSRVLAFKDCAHRFHEECIESLCKYAKQKSGIKCPYCGRIYGVRTGNQPEGSMSVRTEPSQLSGYHNCGTIVIDYNMKPGVQGPQHPNPGRPYILLAFPRQAYLPDNVEGRQILKLLRKAWERNLIFTVGHSVTSGVDDCVVWNDIHHKTERYGNGGGHGFPDPNYFANVRAELAAQGVLDSDEES